jgi:hypothetical protein
MSQNRIHITEIVNSYSSDKRTMRAAILILSKRYLK